MIKYLFLDIDGVLNHQDWYHKIRFSKKYPYRDFDPDCVNRVNRILNETGAKLVISSSWRLDSKLYATFEKVGLPTNFEKTPWVSDVIRGVEIQFFLDNEGYTLNGCTYAIIDDDDDMLPLQKEHFFRTAASPCDEPYERNGGTGLTEKLTNEIIKHLNENH